MAQLYEVLKILANLQERGEYELAQRTAFEHMEQLDSTELRFLHLSVLTRRGFHEQVMDQLETYLQTNRWFSSWFLQRHSEFRELQALARYQEILKACDEKEQQYWQDGDSTPVVQVPTSEKPPYRLLIAVHGNGFNTQHSASQWACAVESGWLVFHPLAQHLVGYGSHWWDAHEENFAIISDQVGRILQQYPISPDSVILGGFSKGGETAMVLALRGQFGARGFITVGAGGYYHLQPEHWRPLLASSKQGLRGVAMYSAYDLARAGGVNQTLEMLREAGANIRMEAYAAEGHVFPEDFHARFQSAVDFVLQTDGQIY